jgi:hypothetical protein
MESSANRKRKISHDEDQEEDDEQKIDKFFALIKNLREARDRLMNGSNGFNGTDQNKRDKMKKVEEQMQTHAVWKPSFQREDFVEEVAAPFKNLPVTALVGSSSQRGGGGGTKENDTDGLDLRLSL